MDCIERLNPRKLRAVVFDFDYTLHDRDRTLTRFLSRQFDELIGPTCSLDRDRYMDYVRSIDRVGRITREEVYDRSIAEFSLPLTRDELIAHFQENAWDEVALYPGVPDLLCRLRKQKIKTGLVTNGLVRSQQAKLLSSGLLPLFDEVMISDEFGVAKPDPAIFREIAWRLAVKPEAVLFVGDNPLDDILGARSVRMRTCLLPGPFGWPDDEPPCADLELERVKQLGHVLGLT